MSKVQDHHISHTHTHIFSLTNIFRNEIPPHPVLSFPPGSGRSWKKTGSSQIQVVHNLLVPSPPCHQCHHLSTTAGTGRGQPSTDRKSLDLFLSLSMPSLWSVWSFLVWGFSPSPDGGNASPCLCTSSTIRHRDLFSSGDHSGLKLWGRIMHQEQLAREGKKRLKDLLLLACLFIRQPDHLCPESHLH